MDNIPYAHTHTHTQFNIQYLLNRKGGKVQKRGKVNLIGRLQLTTEKTKEEDNEGIIALRVLRTQVKICTIIYSVHGIKIYVIVTSSTIINHIHMQKFPYFQLSVVINNT